MEGVDGGTILKYSVYIIGKVSDQRYDPMSNISKSVLLSLLNATQ